MHMQKIWWLWQLAVWQVVAEIWPDYNTSPDIRPERLKTSESPPHYYSRCLHQIHLNDLIELLW